MLLLKKKNIFYIYLFASLNSYRKQSLGAPEKQKQLLVSGKKGINPEIFTISPHLGLRFCSSDYSGKTKEEKLLPTLTIAESFTFRVHSFFLILKNIFIIRISRPKF